MKVIDVLLPAGPEAVATARRALDPLVAALPVRTRDDARLLASELVTNSVRHAHLTPEQAIRLRAAVRGSVLRVDVSDPGLGFTLRPRTEDSPLDSGWGLYLVGEIADRWGVASDAGTSVWFELDVAGSAGERPTGDRPRRRGGAGSTGRFGDGAPGYRPLRFRREPMEVEPHGDARRRRAHHPACQLGPRSVIRSTDPSRLDRTDLRGRGLRHATLDLQPQPALLAARAGEEVPAGPRRSTHRGSHAPRRRCGPLGPGTPLTSRSYRR